LLKTYEVKLEILEKLFNKEDLDIENYSEIKPLEKIASLPNFLFTKPNSHFVFGQLGRKKFNQKTNLLKKIVGQTLAEDLFDIDGKLVLAKNSFLHKKNLEVLTLALQEKKISPLSLPLSTTPLYFLKIKSPRYPGQIISVVGFATDISEEKSYFDLADLICAVSFYCNLKHGLGSPQSEEEKDKLENQIIRRIGDLIYNNLENKLGSFLNNVNNKYLFSLSKFEKADLAKIPNLKDFDNLLRHYFNTSALVQLQNQNNPLAEISYTQKLSVLGLGGFSSSNTTFAARNINSSHYGRYDLVETPEGQRVGLIHNLTIYAKINDYGQIVIPYYPVKNGIISSQKVYLTSEEE
jgi:DNA-directed RNA polymerase subunit beta